MHEIAQPLGVPMKRFEVSQLDKGYEMTVFEDNSDKEMYIEPKRGVASTKEEVAKYFATWLDNDGKDFKF